MINNFSKYMERFDGFETNNLKLLYYDLKDDYVGTYKTYEYSRICTIVDGEKYVKINDEKEFCYGKDEFIVLPPNSHIEMRMNTHTRALVLEISDELLSNVSKNICMDIVEPVTIKKSVDVFRGVKKNAIDYELQSIFNMYVSGVNDKEKAFLIDLSAQKMVYELLKEREVRPLINGNTDRPIAKVIKYIKDNIYEHITMEELAFITGMSASNFSKYFKKIVGVSPTSYIKDMKLKEAKELLTLKNVTEVCYTLGYENISYFIHIFKDKYGVTPKKWQAMQKNSIK